MMLVDGGEVIGVLLLSLACSVLQLGLVGDVLLPLIEHGDQGGLLVCRTPLSSCAWAR